MQATNQCHLVPFGAIWGYMRKVGTWGHLGPFGPHLPIFPTKGYSGHMVSFGLF